MIIINKLINAFSHSITGHVMCYPLSSEENKLIAEEYCPILHLKKCVSTVLIFNDTDSCVLIRRLVGAILRNLGDLWREIAFLGVACI